MNSKPLNLNLLSLTVILFFLSLNNLTCKGLSRIKMLIIRIVFYMKTRQLINWRGKSITPHIQREFSLGKAHRVEMSIFQKIMQNDHFFLGILGRKFLQKVIFTLKGEFANYMSCLWSLMWRKTKKRTKEQLLSIRLIFKSCKQATDLRLCSLNCMLLCINEFHFSKTYSCLMNSSLTNYKFPHL